VLRPPYTAIDDCSRYRVLRPYPRLRGRTSVAFLRRAAARRPVHDPPPADGHLWV